MVNELGLANMSRDDYTNFQVHGITVHFKCKWFFTADDPFRIHRVSYRDFRCFLRDESYKSQRLPRRYNYIKYNMGLIRANNLFCYIIVRAKLLRIY